MAIKTVGVVGCGLMGSGIAQVCAEAGYRVVVREVSDDLLKKGLGKIGSFLAKGVERGKVTPERNTEILGRLEGTTSLEKLSGADIVVEAVVEGVELVGPVHGDGGHPVPTLDDDVLISHLGRSLRFSASSALIR